MTLKKIAQNREARFNYEIVDGLEAGIVLAGHEAKSAKGGNVSLKGSYVSVRGNEVYLIGAHISPYKYAGDLKNYTPTRERKLLLKKEQIKGLIGKYKEQGMALVPMEMYVRRGYVKLKIGIGRGKKRVDKRETIKRREDERRMRRVMRGKKI